MLKYGMNIYWVVAVLTKLVHYPYYFTNCVQLLHVHVPVSDPSWLWSPSPYAILIGMIPQLVFCDTRANTTQVTLCTHSLIDQVMHTITMSHFVTQPLMMTCMHL
jgi:hypothetical protein